MASSALFLNVLYFRTRLILCLVYTYTSTYAYMHTNTCIPINSLVTSSALYYCAASVDRLQSHMIYSSCYCCCTINTIALSTLYVPGINTGLRGRRVTLLVLCLASSDSWLSRPFCCTCCVVSGTRTNIIAFLPKKRFCSWYQPGCCIYIPGMYEPVFFVRAASTVPGIYFIRLCFKGSCVQRTWYSSTAITKFSA